MQRNYIANNIHNVTMKPTINKSRLMKEAHRIRKYEDLNMRIAMKLAWISEKKKAILEAREIEMSSAYNNRSNIKLNINMLANTLINYYANYSYNID